MLDILAKMHAVARFELQRAGTVDADKYEPEEVALRGRVRKQVFRAGHQVEPVTFDALVEIWREAGRLTATTGVQYHVDHIIPVVEGGQTVPWNLRVIPAKENLQKEHDRRRRVKEQEVIW